MNPDNGYELFVRMGRNLDGETLDDIEFAIALMVAQYMLLTEEKAVLQLSETALQIYRSPGDFDLCHGIEDKAVGTLH